MSTAAGTRAVVGERVVLHGVPYKLYVALRFKTDNDHLRMTYNDGTLEIISPAATHEKPGRRLGVFVSVLCEELDIEFECTGHTTMHLPGDGPKKGKGKEPDQGFYFRSAPRLLGRESIDVAEGDPPPDVWLEVDNRVSSRGREPVYAALGVPEVWRYRVRKRTLKFLALGEDAEYRPIDRSLSLPMLTPALVLQGLALGDGLLEGSWTKALRAWVRQRFAPGAQQGD